MGTLWLCVFSFLQFPGCTLCLRAWNDTDELSLFEGFQFSDNYPWAYGQINQKILGSTESIFF